MNAKAATCDCEAAVPSSQRVPFVELVRPTVFAGEGLASLLVDGAGLARRCYEGWRRWLAVRRTLRALDGLDDHVLADVGVYRDEIERVARLVAENPGTDHREFARRSA